MEDIGTTKFSLIIDESTDKSTERQLCLVVRYFSYKKRQMVSTFLAMVNIEEVSATAQVITDAICKFLDDVGLNVENLIGLGTDGASVLCGCNNSVLTKLKEKNPSLVGVR